ncbi:5-formyltetrahydrofolate cyclo-ligase [Legionella longbeachae]|uniref:5-formyltetrahydrofolate cyclo-ligase n=1 Tax=Legionella longbeachae serogroup 1 (strain NSW150) TaxID=661367 RepID=D3HL44_LEGLN|nr:5-formyltetrahydrofolate cyclo-ligase [Legionella longbeachae]ARB93447.1 5-formyltetrahydrofolate cyclo-ligase [Legionella longbeachae]EEZ93703.1 5,10-methenyltetrahydrofolate synthetase [Legionella longbeachae D-4968]QIN33370.1 5-formyltetrahydrofolate cyclo-ligase [Legionella longbeachae]QIN36669.1 5-formyltetrahydrofolate cyclo-ligase [Legionella longbeachae]RZV24736.1 5-formyltetrahydrofolate cyclo-ligase [Legionella longbeachae]
MTNSVKKALRDTMKQIRSKLTASYRLTASNQICTRIRSLEQYRDAQKIAFYSAAHGEIDLDELWKSACLQGKLCYFPVINEDNLTLSFLPATPDTIFKKNRYGIDEPDVSHSLAIPMEEINLALVPIVAFDVRCIRIGMGAGYYDRTFKNNEDCLLFGVAYQFQRVDYIDPEPWDIPLNAVITQRAIYWHGG